MNIMENIEGLHYVVASIAILSGVILTFKVAREWKNLE